LDALIFETYFPEELNSSGKGLFGHIKTIAPIATEMTFEKKIAIIQREFDRLYDPRHPVRNNIETLDSIEVVRTIREALKR
jgi:hypothetical protein